MPVDEDPATLSYTRGPDRPLLDLTIGALLHRTASRFPDRLAVASRHQSARMTWAELSDAADMSHAASGPSASAAAIASASGPPTASSG